MEFVLISFFILPLAAFVASLLLKNAHEKAIASLAIGASGLQVFSSLVMAIYWFVQHQPLVSFNLLNVYRSNDFSFVFSLYYDKLSAVYTIVASILIFIVSIFSRTYLHRESGYKRFYNHFLLFYVGISILSVSGNFETLFLGWEIIGITSFLLISFYRERYLPVKNALKVLSFYRLGDVAVIGAIWFCHHLFHANILFEKLGDTPLLYGVTHHHPIQGLIISLLFVFSAAVKSAQMPFSTWLPRAMEGPTASSAIFYGSLSVHVGVFLLLRTFPIWANIFIVKIIIIVIGALTAVLASFIAAVQPTAKTQIAYSSAAQIGLMFIEIALGWHALALLHFAGNAFLRTYQLLVSPSSMTYLINKQFYTYTPDRPLAFSYLPAKLRNTLYSLSIQEFKLDYLWYNFGWKPFKRIGKSFHFLRNTTAEIAFAVLLVLGVVFYMVYPIEPIKNVSYVSWIYACIALVLILIAWTERKIAIRSWIYIASSQVFFMLSVVEQHSFTIMQVVLYLSGTLTAFLGGFWCLHKVKTIENNIDLNAFHGHIYEHPKFGLFFLICALTMIGFPISPTFVGLDIMFSEIELHHRLLLILSALTFTFLELAVLRIYARVFLGQHVKTYHEVAFRSS